eukprot:gnl/MRDRNA2_/MRDRNA2_144960_c0_seq1.p1 gnl/MRDRNA2_/MRDRNA2_144960_c0~~gnl/MRDRNA2_/MRDRNA2_144960_c0_seq1.p1  ORF type:complete len:301 (-),score=51.78 gnl/MRDRNA2_/MRDRNA2_144960_c0_seq1:85-987(-)
MKRPSATSSAMMRAFKRPPVVQQTKRSDMDLPHSPEFVTLYGAHLSHCCNSVAIALTLKKLPFQLEFPPGSGWHEERGRYKVGYGTEAYRKVMTPMAPQIPGIIAKWDDGRTFKIVESSTILEWLDDVTPEDLPLLPKDPQLRALHRLAIRIHDLHVEPSVRALFQMFELSQSILTERLEKVDTALKMLANIFDTFSDDTDSKCFNGQNFSAVDCIVLPTCVLIAHMMQALRDRPVVWPGVRLGRWYMDAASHPATKSVLAEQHAATADWVRRKRLGKDAFTDGWWHPESYGGVKNAGYP